jgi:hypothetical protein
LEVAVPLATVKDSLSKVMVKSGKVKVRGRKAKAVEILARFKIGLAPAAASMDQATPPSKPSAKQDGKSRQIIIILAMPGC